MGRLKKIRYKTDKIDFFYTVNVSVAGIFSVIIPQEITEKLIKVGIKINLSDKHNNCGYFEANTLDDLKQEIDNIIQKYSKKNLIEKKVVLKYKIETRCSYQKKSKNEYVPNGYWTNENKWINGTDEINVYEGFKGYGMNVTVIPRLLCIWKYPDGEITKKYESLDDSCYKKGDTLHWLNSIVHMGVKDSGLEVEYNEEIGLFFKNLLIFIFKINDRMQDLFGKEIDLSKAIKDGNKMLLPFLNTSEIKE